MVAALFSFSCILKVTLAVTHHWCSAGACMNNSFNVQWQLALQNWCALCCINHFANGHPASAVAHVHVCACSLPSCLLKFVQMKSNQNKDHATSLVQLQHSSGTIDWWSFPEWLSRGLSNTFRQSFTCSFTTEGHASMTLDQLSVNEKHQA